MYNGFGRMQDSRAGKCNKILSVPTAATVAAFIIAVSLTGGCNSTKQAVDSYLEVARNVTSGVATGASGIRKFESLPLSGQSGLTEAIASFRKHVASGQDKTDRVDAPEPCRDLDSKLGTSLVWSREIADIDTQFADYLGAVAPLAKRASDIVTGVANLESENFVASQLLKYDDLAQRLRNDFQAVFTPPLFQPVRDEFESFLDMLVTELDQASGQAERNPPPEQLPSDETSRPETSTAPRRNSSISELINTFNEEWGRTNGAIDADLNAARQSTGLEPKEVALDTLLQEIRQQIDSIAKKF